jgi:acylphosphatase
VQVIDPVITGSPLYSTAAKLTFFSRRLRRTMARVARKFLIHGDVQGVGYRFFAQRAAARHQVLGYVRNCPDGSVESVAEGSATNVEEFKKDLATGPQWANVQQVEEISLEPTGLYSSFRIER